MTGLPSYEEATTRQDWLELIAPYVSFRDYSSLSQVSTRFWRIFAPRLWENPLKTVRLAGLDPSDDISWWFDFVFNKLGAARSAARALVRVLDATKFAKESYHFASDRHDRNMQLSFARALQLCPNTVCILLDGHSDLDLGFLIGHDAGGSRHFPLLLSIADCPYELPGNFFASEVLNKLVYLDVSAVPGSVRPLLRSGLLPNLRVLKLRDRELDDESLITLINLYGKRLWSLDISENRITDGVIQSLRNKCFPNTNLRGPEFFYTEGRLVTLDGGTEAFGPFVVIQESQWSKNFDHTERFFVDSPAYLPNAELGYQEYHVFRATGQERMQSDTAEDMATELSSGDSLLRSTIATSDGLTHLNVSGNLMSAAGIQRLLRTSNGQLEYLACDAMPLISSSQSRPHWPATAQLIGTIGAADLFRPVISSNLRSLRVHHSLVTGLLDLQIEGFSGLSRAYLAEQVILPRIESLCAGAFVPAMNPRLSSLILTHVPRRSSGPLITRLLAFMKLLSQQERAIQDTMAASTSSRRSPDVLSGLRHLRLEFDPDPLEEGFSAAEDLDAEDLMNSGDQGFSFFEGEQYEKSPAYVRHDRSSGQAENADQRIDDATPAETDRPQEETITYEGEWEAKAFSVQVWLGPKFPSVGSAWYQYRRLVQVHQVRDGVGPALPAQLRAGAPEGSYIFHTAWALAIMPLELKAPEKSQLQAMEDVLDSLKRHRIEGRQKYAKLEGKLPHARKQLGEPHYFWTGKLEVSTQQTLPQGRVSQYWR